MALSISKARPGAGACVEITLTRADVGIIACAVRSELASEWERIFATPLPGREGISRIRAILDGYEGMLDTLEPLGPRADVEIECPVSQLDVVSHDLLGGVGERTDDHRVAVCAMVEHLLTAMHGSREGDRERFDLATTG